MICRLACRVDEVKKKKKKKKEKAKLSFGDDEEDDGEDSGTCLKEEVIEQGTELTYPAPLTSPPAPPSKKAKVIKNPAVDTSFLPDRERDTRERQEREDLRRKWLKDQETLKNEDVEITYSYWDGAGHRRVVKVRPDSFTRGRALELKADHVFPPVYSARRETTSRLSSKSAVSSSQSCAVQASTI